MKGKSWKEKFRDAINAAGEGVDDSNRDLIAVYADDDCLRIAREYTLEKLRNVETMENVKNLITLLEENLKK